MRNTLFATVVFAASVLVTTAYVSAANKAEDIAPPPSTAIPAPVAPQDAPVKDPVESLNEAIKEYQAGKFSDALASIDAAKKAVGAKHLAIYQALLPPAPGPGWAVNDKPDTILMSGVTRDYNANGQTVSISYTVEPSMVKMLSSTSKMVSAMFGGTNDANNDKPIMIKGQKATYQEMKIGDKILSYKLDIAAGDALVSVQSSTIGKDTLVKFAELVDYDKLKAAH